jgi:hypothetical protein
MGSVKTTLSCTAGGFVIAANVQSCDRTATALNDAAAAYLAGEFDGCAFTSMTTTPTTTASSSSTITISTTTITSATDTTTTTTTTTSASTTTKTRTSITATTVTRLPYQKIDTTQFELFLQGKQCSSLNDFMCGKKFKTNGPDIILAKTSFGKMNLSMAAESCQELCIEDMECHGINLVQFPKGTEGTVRVFEHDFALEDAIGSHACSLEALTCV